MGQSSAHKRRQKRHKNRGEVLSRQIYFQVVLFRHFDAQITHSCLLYRIPHSFTIFTTIPISHLWKVKLVENLFFFVFVYLQFTIPNLFASEFRYSVAQILVCGAEDFVILDLKFNFHYFYSPFPISQLWNVKLSKISKFWNHFDLFAILQFFTTLKFSSLTPRCKPGIEMAAVNIQLIIIIGMKVKVIFNGIGKSGKSWCISMYEN